MLTHRAHIQTARGTKSIGLRLIRSTQECRFFHDTKGREVHEYRGIGVVEWPPYTITPLDLARAQ